MGDRKLVFLDAGSIGDDFTWPDYSRFGEVVMHDLTLPDQTAERVKDATFILTNKVFISAKHIAAAKKLRFIGVLATGFNQVDIGAAAARGIPVCNVPDYSTNSVSQHVFTLALLLCSRAVDLVASVRTGQWSKSVHFCYWDKPIIDLYGKTMGIVGFGNIGAAVARIAHGFGMNVLAYAPRPKPAPDFRPFAFAGIDELFRSSDVISLHCPLNAETRGMINASLLRLMKKTAFIVNTARGPLINEEDLLEALESESIAGAGLDVVSREPMADNNPLRFAKNCVITPHVAWCSVESRKFLMELVYDNIKAYVDGAPVNVVNGI
ncbi:MAG: D-2-hydroxyacid dehydrogenase [Desulfovibrio sp.]|jgi:glycerate dehydrogenase|nr:D-2-hydroxyacid dehydrogenase [Desulfovibrio sp.]